MAKARKNRNGPLATVAEARKRRNGPFATVAEATRSQNGPSATVAEVTNSRNAPFATTLDANPILEDVRSGDRRAAVRGNLVSDAHLAALVGSPEITLLRMVEEGPVVVAEGRVRSTRADGGRLDALFCNVFELEGGKIRRIVSYLMEVSEGKPGVLTAVRRRLC
ncbi:MAG TPA: nuclear transport factor 2 family protein [Thermoanaerobaculia bacterium]|nr:nuclear transport factor 2 family protein [Thermoanaerobaculia bacterium]